MKFTHDVNSFVKSTLSDCPTARWLAFKFHRYTSKINEHKKKLVKEWQAEKKHIQFNFGYMWFSSDFFFSLLIHSRALNVDEKVVAERRERERWMNFNSCRATNVLFIRHFYGLMLSTTLRFVYTRSLARSDPSDEIEWACRLNQRERRSVSKKLENKKL